MTETMTIKFEAVSNTPLAGAHNAYLVLFTIDKEVPPGSKIHVTNLVGSISARSAPFVSPGLAAEMISGARAVTSFVLACSCISGETRP